MIVSLACARIVYFTSPMNENVVKVNQIERDVLLECFGSIGSVLFYEMYTILFFSLVSVYSAKWLKKKKKRLIHVPHLQADIRQMKEAIDNKLYDHCNKIITSIYVDDQR